MVMAGLVPSVHVVAEKQRKTLMPETSPGMTNWDYNLISPRLMLAPSVAATDLAGRPEAAISTV